jgi:hypothetical protein
MAMSEYPDRRLCEGSTKNARLRLIVRSVAAKTYHGGSCFQYLRD